MLMVTRSGLETADRGIERNHRHNGLTVRSRDVGRNRGRQTPDDVPATNAASGRGVHDEEGEQLTVALRVWPG
jgi:hypothetical protein